MRDRSCDVLVVGHGAAGCLAGRRLACRGMEVIIVGRGTTATALSTGRIDLSGVHSHDELAKELRALGEDHGLFQAPPGAREAVTHIGTVGVQDLVSAHDWIIEEGEVAVVGLRGNRDLDPDLLSAVIGESGAKAVAAPYWIDPGLPTTVPTGRGDTLTEEALSAVDALSMGLRELNEERVVLPPVFGGANHALALARLERTSGRRVLEPATPLSNPGQRLQSCLEDGAVKAGCRLLRDREVVELVADGRVMREARVRSGMRELSIEFRSAVLAGGNLVAGGLIVEGGEVRDPLGKFRIERGRGRALASPELSAALSAGIASERGRALSRDGVAFENVFVAGSVVPGLSYPLGKGLGSVLASAWKVAERVKEAM